MPPPSNNQATKRPTRMVKSRGRRSSLSDCDTVISAMTMDSCFPPVMEIVKPSKRSVSKEVKPQQEYGPPQHELEARLRLAKKIKALQEKVRLAKMIEEVFEQSIQEEAQDQRSFSQEEMKTTATPSVQCSTESKLEKHLRRGNGSENGSFWSGVDESTATAPSFDPDFFQQSKEAMEVPLCDFSSCNSADISATSSKRSNASKMSTASKRSNASGRCSKRSSKSPTRHQQVVQSALKMPVKTADNEADQKNAGLLLVNFPEKISESPRAA